MENVAADLARLKVFDRLKDTPFETIESPQ